MHEQFPPTIWAYTQIKNSWPLARFGITHHLDNVADVVIVVNHASTDETARGLTELKTKYGPRLIVFSLPDSYSHQKVVTNLLLRNIPLRQGDWFLIFDGDELIMSNRPMRTVLESVPKDIDDVTIPVFNFLSFRDFDENADSDFRDLGFKATVIRQIPLNTEDDLIKPVETFQHSYFDYPFLNKHLMRWHEGLSWDSGAHKILGTTQPLPYQLPTTDVYFAHFPMLSRFDLMRREKNGRSKIQRRLSASSGWQSQVVSRVSEAGNIDQFWELNSLESRSKESNLSYHFDTRVNLALCSAVDSFARQSDDTGTKLSEELTERLVMFQQDFNVCDALLTRLDELERQADRLQKSIEWKISHKLSPLIRRFRLRKSTQK